MWIVTSGGSETINLEQCVAVLVSRDDCEDGGSGLWDVDVITTNSKLPSVTIGEYCTEHVAQSVFEAIVSRIGTKQANSCLRLPPSCWDKSFADAINNMAVSGAMRKDIDEWLKEQQNYSDD